MKPLRRAVVAGLTALAACRAPSTDAPAGVSSPADPVALQVAAVQPEFLPAFDELQRALAANDDAVARRILRGIQARSPTGRALSLAQAFERVLDGREAVSELTLALVARPEPSASSANPTTPSARFDARLLFVVENTAAVPIELRPGPASLRVTKTSVGRQKSQRPGDPSVGGEEQSSETQSYPELRHLALEAGGKREIELARFFIDVPDGDLAVRLAFDLDLRSGSVVRDGRELPAMNVAVASCDVTRWTALRYPEWEPTAESLEKYVLQAAPIAADTVLEIAVRIPSGERDRALDRLAARESEISEPHFLELVAALRWLTQDPTLGGDADLWRAYLQKRARGQAKQRPKLELPVRTE